MIAHRDHWPSTIKEEFSLKKELLEDGYDDNFVFTKLNFN